MKPTTTPNGATLSYHEVGDTLQIGDIWESGTTKVYVVGHEKAGGFMPGNVVQEWQLAFRPRRYIPKEET